MYINAYANKIKTLSAKHTLTHTIAHTQSEGYPRTGSYLMPGCDFLFFFPTSLLIYSGWSGHKTLRRESSAINLWPYLILSPGLGKWNRFISKSVTYTSNASLYPAEAKVSPSHHSYIYATSPEGQWCERGAAGYGDEMSLCGLNFLTSCSTFLRCTYSLSLLWGRLPS